MLILRLALILIGISNFTSALRCYSCFLTEPYNEQIGADLGLPDFLKYNKECESDPKETDLTTLVIDGLRQSLATKGQQGLHQVSSDLLSLLELVVDGQRGQGQGQLASTAWGCVTVTAKINGTAASPQLPAEMSIVFRGGLSFDFGNECIDLDDFKELAGGSADLIPSYLKELSFCGCNEGKCNGKKDGDLDGDEGATRCYNCAHSEPFSEEIGKDLDLSSWIKYNKECESSPRESDTSTTAQTDLTRSLSSPKGAGKGQVRQYSKAVACGTMKDRTKKEGDREELDLVMRFGLAVDLEAKCYDYNSFQNALNPDYPDDDSPFLDFEVCICKGTKCNGVGTMSLGIALILTPILLITSQLF